MLLEHVPEELKKNNCLGTCFKSSMLTIITLLALSIGSLLGGTAIVESIFMWPGVGKLAVDAISTRDYQVIQVYVIWMAIIYVVINLITDLVYHYLDPRIRIQGREGNGMSGEDLRLKNKRLKKDYSTLKLGFFLALVAGLLFIAYFGQYIVPYDICTRFK